MKRAFVDVRWADVRWGSPKTFHSIFFIVSPIVAFTFETWKLYDTQRERKKSAEYLCVSFPTSRHVRKRREANITNLSCLQAAKLMATGDNSTLHNAWWRPGKGLHSLVQVGSCYRSTHIKAWPQINYSVVRSLRENYQRVCLLARCVSFIFKSWFSHSFEKRKGGKRKAWIRA